MCSCPGLCVMHCHGTDVSCAPEAVPPAAANGSNRACTVAARRAGVSRVQTQHVQHVPKVQANGAHSHRHLHASTELIIWWHDARR